MVTQLVPQYGWYILLGLILLMVAWTQLRHHVYAWLQRRNEQVEERNFDPVKAEKYQDGMLLAREKMQRVQDEKAKEYQEKKMEQEDEERDERIRQWETFGVVSKSKKRNPGKGGPGRFPSTREYFPLGGGGGGGGYRPPRRTGGEPLFIYQLGSHCHTLQ